MSDNKRIIISGGGTGGHIFPAISIANSIKKIYPETEILFVGAKGKIEMEKVPEAGYKIEGLTIAGFQRKLTFKNVTFFFKLISSLLKARKIVRRFKPDVVVGVGGYASGPLLYMASKRKIPALIQEQNSYPGITNKLLAKVAQKICVAYENMERFFQKDKIILTGNPVRSDIISNTNREDAYSHFGLSSDRKTILVVGGSLGAGTVNKSIMNSFDTICNGEFQLIWQTGKFYYDDIISKLGGEAALKKYNNVKVTKFISRMDYAFEAADVIISRAGAGTISELCIVGKPIILVPSPNVAEDHQTCNAMALVEKDAAIMVRDKNAEEELVKEAHDLLKDEEKQKELSANIKKLALPDSSDVIAKEVMKMAGINRVEN